MIGKIYLSLTMLSVGVTFGFGLCFMFLKIPDSTFLQNYRKARYSMAFAYIILSVLDYWELVVSSAESDILFTRATTLIMSSYQAFLFAYTFICLINPKFLARKKIVTEISILLFFTTGLFIVLSCNNALYFNIGFCVYILFYLSLLVRYTNIFFKIFHHYKFQSDNYFTEDESKRIEWIFYSFFLSLIVGVGALLLTFSGNIVHYIIFTVVFICFYCYFGINFIDYAFRYQYIEQVVGGQGEIEITEDVGIQDNRLKDSVEHWAERGGYMHAGLTIELLAKELNTNRTYLSNYINKVEGKSFREWINYQRIEVARELLVNRPEMTIHEISLATGYSNSSNFNKQFVKVTGLSAQAWRLQNK